MNGYNLFKKRFGNWFEESRKKNTHLLSNSTSNNPPKEVIQNRKFLCLKMPAASLKTLTSRSHLSDMNFVGQRDKM